MAIYELGWSAAGVNGTLPLFSIITDADSRVRLLEMGFCPTTTSQNGFALGRPSSQGTASTTVAMLATNPSDPTCPADIGTAWSVNPGVPTAGYLRMYNCGGGNIPWKWRDWRFPRGIMIPASDSLVMWNFRVSLASVQTDIYVSVDV